MKNKLFPFYLLTIALFIGLIVPVLIQDGMFMDGMLYTCVAKNLGNGIGSFWFPISDAAWMTDGKASFHEHPPLVFAIQSVFYKVLGNSMYVERFYSFLTACITGVLIFLTWKEIFRNKKELLNYAWLAVLLWIIVPVAHWSFQNNMQENTMGIFSLMAVYFIFKGLNGEKKILFHMIAAGIFIFLASFSKGVPGIFPIGTIGLYWLIYRKPRFYWAAIYTLIVSLIPILIYYFLLLNPDAKEALSFYLNHRLLGRIETAPTVTNRFHTLVGLFSHLLPSLILSVIVIFVFMKKSIKNYFIYKKEFLFFVLVGLSASLPLMFTMVQKDFYFSHSIPYFGIAFALLLAPGLSGLIDKIDISKTGFKIFSIFSIFLIVFAIGFSVYNIGGQSRDADELNDVHLLGKHIPENSIIDIDASINDQYNTRYYLVRYYNISSTISDKHNYLLLQKSVAAPIGYTKLELNTKKYDLFKKTSTP